MSSYESCDVADLLRKVIARRPRGHGQKVTVLRKLP
jgi:hypothetical protein